MKITVQFTDSTACVVVVILVVVWRFHGEVEDMTKTSRKRYRLVYSSIHCTSEYGVVVVVVVVLGRPVSSVRRGIV